MVDDKNYCKKRVEQASHRHSLEDLHSSFSSFFLPFFILMSSPRSFVVTSSSGSRSTLNNSVVLVGVNGISRDEDASIKHNIANALWSLSEETLACIPVVNTVAVKPVVTGFAKKHDYP